MIHQVSNLQVNLVVACIALHIFNAVGLFYSHPYLSKQLFIFNQEDAKLAEFSSQLSFVARVAGGYVLGKMVSKYGFINTMRFICASYLSISIIMFFFNENQGVTVLCVAQSLYSFFRISSIIIPTVYVLQHCNNLKKYQYSTMPWLAAILGAAAINLCSTLLVNAKSYVWCTIYAATSLITLIIYSCILPVPENKNENYYDPLTMKSIILAFLFAGIGGAGIFYQYFVVENYIVNVQVIESAGQQIIYSPFWITLVLVLFSTARVTEHLGTVNNLCVSLLGIILSVSLLYIYTSLTHSIFVAHQILFGIFFGLYLSPSFLFICRLLCNTKYPFFYMNFIFLSGWSVLGWVTIYGSMLNFTSAPFWGAMVIILLMLICLFMLLRYNFPKLK